MSGIIERWRSWLPVHGSTPIVTLGEGSTPLIPIPSVAELLGGGRRVFVKFEGANPTGSFKDRGMTLAISKALEEGAEGVICASTGNTSASAAAYSGRCGLPCWVVLPRGKVATGKLAQALIHGARVVPVEGSFDDALELVKGAVEERGLTLVNSLNPFRLEGQKTVAFEIAEELGEPPDAHFLPVGNAGNITATWRGYRQLVEDLGRHARRPRMIGFQASGAAPIVHGKPVARPETIATAIRIGNPAWWKGATAAIEESGGSIGSVSDRQILFAYRHLARREGVFCEPASAASVAGLLTLVEEGKVPVPPGGTVVCTLTGHGLKDPERAVAESEVPEAIPARLDALLEGMDT
ncbi:MAG: threonine synthase [Planctomycetota bacterium]